jgi:hypothetical protein
MKPSIFELLDKVEAQRNLLPGPAPEMEPGDALDYLRGVYQGKIAGEAVRMKAAIAALPFERPKLAVIANVTSFADQLEAVSRQLGQSPVIDAPRALAAPEVLEPTGR